MRVGFIGLGTMGAPMAARLVGAGYEVTAFDVRPDAVAALAERGARGATSVLDVARASDAILTSLPSLEAVREVLLDPREGVVAGLSDGSLLIELSTVSVATSIEIAETFGNTGVHAIDAPVSAASGRAEDGALTILIGGREDAVARARPLLETLGTRIFHLGPAGAGTATKLATQYMGLCNAVAAAEGSLLAEAAGVDLDVFSEAVPGTIGQSLMHQYALDWVRVRHQPDPAESRGVVAIFEKDIRLAVEAMGHMAAPHRLGSIVAEIYAAAIAQGWENRPFMSPVQILETELNAPEVGTSAAMPGG